jgi:formate dehydrogenase iron-sulfur subunit
MSKGMLIDTTMCIGCLSCEVACSEKNQLGECDESDLSACKFTKVFERGDYYVRKMCMHCKEPACASVCPVGALTKLEEGPVIYDEKKCIGCRYCMQACPFQIPTYEWASALPRVRKCWFCYDRVLVGEQPACAEVCPTGATMFGDRASLLVEARRRIKENPGQYHDHIFGEREVGGTSMLFLSAVPFDQIGFKSNLIEKPLPLLTWNVLSKIPDFVLVGGTLLGGVAWVINRRMQLEDERIREAEERRMNGLEPPKKGLARLFERIRKG